MRGDKVELIADGAGSIWTNLISAKTKYPEICMDIFKELAKPEYDVIMHEADALPPVLSGTLTLDNEYFGTLAYAEAMMNSKDKAPAPAYDSIPQSGSIQVLFGELCSKVLNTEKIDIKAELDNLAAQIDQLLAQN